MTDERPEEIAREIVEEVERRQRIRATGCYGGVTYLKLERSVLLEVIAVILARERLYRLGADRLADGCQTVRKS